jgi:PKD repeat protein
MFALTYLVDCLKLANLRKNKQSITRKGLRRRARLQVEALEARETPSSSAPLAPVFTGAGLTTTSTTPTLSWSATAGAIDYDLWVNNVTTGATQVIRAPALTTNSYTPAAALPSDSYQAWVRTITAAGTSVWSAAYNFTIAPPAIPTLTAPTGSASTLTPSFSWTASTNAARYDLWVNNLATGQVIRQRTLTSNSFTPSTALAPGSYVAWVQAYNNAGNSSGWSAGLNFKIGLAPTLTAPTGSSAVTTPTFVWTAVAGATRYQLWVNNLTTGQSQVISKKVTTTSFTPSTPLSVGSYEAWVQAYNGSSALGGWSVGLNFTIVASSAPLNVSAGPSETASMGSAVKFSGSATGGTGALTCSWAFGDGSTATGSLAPSHTYGHLGTYTATLTVTDSVGNSKQSSTTATVTSTTSPLTVSAGPNVSGNEGSSIKFSGSASGGTGALSYSWAFGDGGTATGSLAPSHTYANYGTFTATLTVTDGSGTQNKSTTTVTVNDVAPTVSIGGPYTGTVGTAIAFTGSGNDPSAQETAALKYSWNFGDGTTSTLQNPSHTYAAANTYNVSLIVTDPAGLSTTATTTAVVSTSAPANLKVSPSTLPTGTTNSAYSATFGATGGSGTYTFAVTAGNLPAGLTLNASTGALSGSPSAAGSSSFTITATDSKTSGLTGSQAFTVTVNSSSSTGHTYYVATNGKDSNNGSATAPFATLQQAMMSLHPGDTLNVEPGSYAGFVAGWDSAPATSGDLYGTVAGTAAAPITIQADPSAAPGSVIINKRANEVRYGIDLEPGCDYVHLIGFTIADSGGITTSSDRGGGIKVVGNNDQVINNTVTNIVYGFGIIADNANNVLLKNNTVTGTGSQGNDNYGHGIYISGSLDGAVVQGNVIHNNDLIGIHINGDVSEGGVGLVTHALIENNLIYNNGQNGINADGLQSSVIENNLIYGYQNYGIALYQIDASDGSKNNVIVNNTIVSTVSGAGAAVRILDGGTGNTILNNILLGGSGVALRISNDSLSGLVSNDNIGASSSYFQSEDSGSTQTLAQWRTQKGQDANSLTATTTQLFANAAGNNYHLASGSPALNAGTNTDAPATDILGIARPLGQIDIGAYQG